MKSEPLKTHKLLGYYLFFAYFSVLPQLVIFVTGSAGFSGFRQAILMSLIWLIPIFIFPHRAKLVSALNGGR